jgi:hypothetical protein
MHDSNARVGRVGRVGPSVEPVARAGVTTEARAVDARGLNRTAGWFTISSFTTGRRAARRFGTPTPFEGDDDDADRQTALEN